MRFVLAEGFRFTAIAIVQSLSWIVRSHAFLPDARRVDRVLERPQGDF